MQTGQKLHWTVPFSVIPKIALRLSNFQKATMGDTFFVITENQYFKEKHEFIEITWDKCPNCNSGSKQPASWYVDVYCCDNCKHMWDIKDPTQYLKYGSFRPFNKESES
jgi:hypothetical protein